MSSQSVPYYVPEDSTSTVWGTIGLFFLGLGAVGILNGVAYSLGSLLLGVGFFAVMLWQWFSSVVRESLSSVYSAQVDRSFRWGMGWFIFSEVMFFSVFFGALYYVRIFVLPLLESVEQNAYLWPSLVTQFSSQWPLVGAEGYIEPYQAMGAMGLPLINTGILLLSSVLLTLSHHRLLENRCRAATVFLAGTVFLGIIFLGGQILEYWHAIEAMELKLSSGIYGSLFYMLTGIHGVHVLLGALMLAVVLIRMAKGHFSAERCFAFEAVAWYWHFVDVVWLLLFVVVYWM